MIKFRIYLDKEAEEKWLNQMAADGWAMESFFGGIYQFSACEKGAYTYRVDFGDKLFSISEDYRELMQDAGCRNSDCTDMGLLGDTAKEDIRRSIYTLYRFGF